MHKTLFFKLLFFIFLFINYPKALSRNYIHYKIKPEFIVGDIISHNKAVFANLKKGPIHGISIAAEFEFKKQSRWNQAYRYPSFGIALQTIDLGNPKLMGQFISAIPYIHFPIFESNITNIHIDIGTGIALCTKPFDRKNYVHTDNDYANYNFAIGSYLNVNVKMGFGAIFKIDKHWAVTTSLHAQHFSNGSSMRPNHGINLYDGSIGVLYSANEKPMQKTYEKPVKEKPWSIEIKFASGPKHRFFTDKKFFMAHAFNISGHYRTCFFHSIGLSADAFYNGMFTNDSTGYDRAKINQNKLKYKIKIGTSVENELIINRFSLSICMGIYLYNPTKNYEPNASDNHEKNIFYYYNIKNEDGWFYWRAIGKFRFGKHFFIHAGCKFHQMRSDYLLIGIGTAF